MYFIDLLAGAHQEQKRGEAFVLKVKGESVTWLNSHLGRCKFTSVVEESSHG